MSTFEEQAREPKSELHRLRISIAASRNALSNAERKVTERQERLDALIAQEAELAAEVNA